MNKWTNELLNERLYGIFDDICMSFQCNWSVTSLRQVRRETAAGSRVPWQRPVWERVLRHTLVQQRRDGSWRRMRHSVNSSAQPDLQLPLAISPSAMTSLKLNIHGRSHAPSALTPLLCGPHFKGALNLTWKATSVASLGLVSPGVATDGCHPIFSWKNLTTFLVIASESDDLFICHLLTSPIFLRRLSSVLSKFSYKKLILGRV